MLLNQQRGIGRVGCWLRTGKLSKVTSFPKPEKPQQAPDVALLPAGLCLRRGVVVRRRSDGLQGGVDAVVVGLGVEISRAAVVVLVDPGEPLPGDGERRRDRAVRLALVDAPERLAEFEVSHLALVVVGVQ